MKFSLAAVVLSAVGPTIALAENCESPQTQAEMTFCAKKAYEEADAELNQVYQEVIANLSEGERKALVKQQRVWIGLRDATCTDEASRVEGGSAQPMYHYNCLERETRARTTALQQRLPI